MHFSLKKKIRCSFENTYTLIHILLVQRISSKTDAIFRAKILLHWTPVLRNASYLKPKSQSQSVSQIPLWKMVFLVVCGEIMISGPSASLSPFLSLSHLRRDLSATPIAFFLFPFSSYYNSSEMASNLRL